MITIPNSYISSTVLGSEHLTKGLSLIESWITDLAIPDRISPVIAGGAVRDVFFKNQTPHDIDIFFTISGAVPASRRREVGLETYQRVMEWLEDQEITTTSLSVERRREYEGDTQYLDIIEIEWQGIPVQLMFPEYPSNINTLMDSFPMMCKGMLGREALYFPLTGYAAMSFELPVSMSGRDWNYVCKKYPGQSVAHFATTSEMSSYIAHRLHMQAGGVIETVSVPQARVGSPMPTTYFSATECLKRDIVRRFNIPSVGVVPNVIAAISNDVWTTGRAGSEYDF